MKKLWLDERGQARVCRRTARADDRLGRVYQAHRLLEARASDQPDEALDAEAIKRASQLLSPSLTGVG